MAKHSVVFMPEKTAVLVEEGTSIFRAAAMAGLELKSTCGSKGTCGRCTVRVLEGRVKQQGGNLSARSRRAGYVLACQTLVLGNVVVEVPAEARLSEHQVLLTPDDKPASVLQDQYQNWLEGFEFQPIGQKVYLELDPPSINENLSDLDRLQAALRKQLGTNVVISISHLQVLAEVLRAGDWKITVTLAYCRDNWEMIHLEPGKSEKPCYGLAVDIGTTTVVTYLVDLDTGATVGKRGTYNKQARYGDDVISRVIYANEPGGLDELHQAVVGTVNELVNRLLNDNSLQPEDLHVMVYAGNTIMTHLFLGLPPKYIRLSPYIPTASDYPDVKAKELGLLMHPEAAVFSFSSVASYVGGDIVSGVLVTKQAQQDEIVLFIDIGTNGEMVLGNRDWMISCACSAGPAFEGGGITFGMRAMQGAIERVEIDPDTMEVKLQTVGNAPPVGICGSGLIDCLAKLRRAGIIDRTGQFQMDLNSPRIRQTDEDKEFVLAWANQSGSQKDIIITENDVKNLIRSKGALFAGIQSLLKSMGMSLEMVDQIRIAGGFGNYLNITDSIAIGLLPDLDRSKYQFVGNTSIKGAHLALLSRQAWEESRKLARMMTYLELSAGTTFMDEFISALFIPHTDLSLFPSLAD